MQTAFMSFLPNQVTDSSIVYTVMKNFVALTKKLQPVACDEGVIDFC